MIKWYLVLYIVTDGGIGMTTIPNAYETKELCNKAAIEAEWDNRTFGYHHKCISSVKVVDKGYVCQSGQNVCPVVK